MDFNTKKFLESIGKNTVEQNVAKVKSIYKKFADEESFITIDTVIRLFNEINVQYYNGMFYEFIKTTKRENIHFVDSGKSCEESEAMLEAVEYEVSDDEYSQYDYGFHIALTCINSEPEGTLYYSGGYITRKKIIFIILMLLHESIHIIEYKDSFLTNATTSHTAFFYTTAYRLFGIISRLSEINLTRMNLTTKNTERLNGIKKLLNNKNITDDGIELLNDHSSYIDEDGVEELLGYIVIYNKIIENSKTSCNTRKRRNSRNTRRNK